MTVGVQDPDTTEPVCKYCGFIRELHDGSNASAVKWSPVCNSFRPVADRSTITIDAELLDELVEAFRNALNHEGDYFRADDLLARVRAAREGR